MRTELLLVAAALAILAPTSACVSRRVVVVNHPGYAAPPAYNAYYHSGQVRLETRAQGAGVFVNGAYAGTVRQNRLMRLSPGNYTIEIRGAGGERYAENIRVVAGNTLHLNPGF